MWEGDGDGRQAVRVHIDRLGRALSDPSVSRFAASADQNDFENWGRHRTDDRAISLVESCLLDVYEPGLESSIAAVIPPVAPALQGILELERGLLYPNPQGRLAGSLQQQGEGDDRWRKSVR